MATEPQIPQKSPYVIEEEPGVKWWCSCGRSKNQPYCDGSHAGTDLTPIQVEIKEAKKIAWCGCKQSGNNPYCDGTHAKL